MVGIRNTLASSAILRDGRLVVQEMLAKSNSITDRERKVTTTHCLRARNCNHLRLEVRPVRISHSSYPKTKPHSYLLLSPSVCRNH